MKSIPLEEMLAFLRAQSHQSFCRGAVDGFLETHAVTPASLAPFTYFREDTYARNLIARTDRFELIVIAWLPRHRTPIHDHGGQRCWMWVDTGELTFANYENAPSDRPDGPFNLVLAFTSTTGSAFTQLRTQAKSRRYRFICMRRR